METASLRPERDDLSCCPRARDDLWFYHGGGLYSDLPSVTLQASCITLLLVVVQS